MQCKENRAVTCENMSAFYNNPYPNLINLEKCRWWLREDIVSYLLQPHIHQMFHPMLKQSNNNKCNKPITTHPKHGIYNWNYIFGHLLERDIFLYKNVWSTPNLHGERFSIHFSLLEKMYHRHERRYCYHQLMASSASGYIDLMITTFYDDTDHTKMILGTLCKQCRIEIALRLPDIMNNFGAQNDEESFMRFRATILNNCLLQYQCTKLLLSNVDWFNRMMIEITIMMQSDVSLGLELMCFESQQAGEDHQDVRDKCDMMEFCLRPIEMLTRCIGFFKNMNHWSYLLFDIESFVDSTNIVGLVQRVLLKEAKKWNDYYDKEYIESKPFHFTLVQQIMYILCIFYYKIMKNDRLFKRFRMNRKHQHLMDTIRKIKSKTSTTCEMKRNEICDILLLMFGTGNNKKSKQFVKLQGRNMKLYHRWYRDFVKECQSIRCNKRKIMIRNKKNATFYKCKGCFMVYYCSKKCQKYDWNTFHRFNCKRLSRMYRDYISRPFDSSCN
eukprot:756165_1